MLDLLLFFLLEMFFIMPTTTPVGYFAHISLGLINMFSAILLRVFQFLVNLDIYNVISCFTLNIFSLVYILKFILIYFEGRKLENCNRFLRLPLNKVIHSFILLHNVIRNGLRIFCSEIFGVLF